MTPDIIIAIGVIASFVALFFLQPLMRRRYNDRLLSPIAAVFEGVTRREVTPVTGVLEGRLQGRGVGISFVSRGAREKRTDRSMVEVWAESRGTVPFSAKATPGAMFDRSFELTSSRAEQFAAIQQRTEMTSALEALSEAGAESVVYPGSGRVMVVFRPFRKELLQANNVNKLLSETAAIAHALE